MEAHVVVDIACEVGEGPLWHPKEQRLYWTDIPRGRVYSYSPSLDTHVMVLETDPVASFTFQANGSLLLFMKSGKVASWQHGRLRSVIDSLPGSQDTIFNDSIADPEGRVFVGMKAGSEHKGQLYRLDQDGSIRLVLDGLGEPNGMGFTRDLGCLYFTDTFAGDVYLFDYDRASGDITNQRVFAHVPESDGMPDGMTVDSEGCVWSALWDGGCVIRHSPEGRELERLALPVPKISSVTFGGPALTDLYITTSGGGDRAKNGPLAGSVFRAKSDVAGVPEFHSRVWV